MSKKIQEVPFNLLDPKTYDCGNLPLHVERAIAERRMPTEIDLAEIGKYTEMQLCVYMSRLNNSGDSRRLVQNWSDCVGYTLLLASVSEKAAEYNCPKSRWLTEVKS